MQTPRVPQKPRFGKMRNLAQVVHAGMLGGLVVLGLVVYLIQDQMPEPRPELSPLYLVAGAVLSAGCVAMAVLLPRNLVKRVPRDQLALRLTGFAYSRVLFAACIEAAGLFWAVLALVSGNMLYLIGPAAAVAVLLVTFPFQGRMEQALGVSEEQADRILGHD